MGRSRIAIDHRLIEKAMESTGARTEREAVEIVLRRVRDRSGVYGRLRALRGKLEWGGPGHVRAERRP